MRHMDDSITKKEDQGLEGIHTSFLHGRINLRNEVTLMPPIFLLQPLGCQGVLVDSIMQ
jgi:hypothetical protein